VASHGAVSGVSTTAGAIALTRIAYWPSSTAIVCMML
jgi:hypothetical protein